MVLREQRVADRKDHVIGIDDEACHRALRDEMRIVIEREKDVDRTGADRQRRHQAADQWSGALGRDRRREHEGGGDGHLDDEREREIKIGGHCSRA